MARIVVLHLVVRVATSVKVVRREGERLRAHQVRQAAIEVVAHRALTVAEALHRRQARTAAEAPHRRRVVAHTVVAHREVAVVVVRREVVQHRHADREKIDLNRQVYEKSI